MTKRRKRVVFIAHQSNMYGASQCLLSLVAGLDTAQYKMCVVCPEEGRFVEKCREVGVWVAVIDKFPPADNRVSLGFLMKFLYRLSYLHKLFTFLKRFAPDLAYVNTLLSSSAVLACKLLSIPVITHVHEYRWRLSQLNPVRRWLVLHGSDEFIAVSQAVKDMLVEQGVPSSRIAVVYNGFPIEDRGEGDLSADLRENWGAIDGETILGVIGSIEPHKGLITLVRAMSIIQAQGIPFKLIVVGDVPSRVRPDYFGSVGRLVSQLGLAEQIIFEGFQTDVLSRLIAFDIVVVPSLEESFGRVAVEAMLTGKPVVASNVGALPEVVLDGETGLLVEPQSPQALASAICKLIASPELREELGCAGRHRAMSMFTLERYVAQIENMVGWMIDEPS